MRATLSRMVAVAGPVLRRGWTVPLLLACLLACLPAVALPARADDGVAMGLAVDPVASRDLAAFDARTTELGGIAPALWMLWVQWGGENTAFPPEALLDGLVARGALPVVNWEPVNPARLASPRFRYARIAAGRHDAYIRTFARAAAAWGGPLYLRFAHEMNGRWFPWGMGRFDNTPARFVAAWRRIHRIIRAEGATNVRMLWSPYVGCRCPSYARLYPGRRYVDLVGFSAFNWYRRGTRVRWVGMRRLYAPAVRELRRVAPGRPVIVAETGSSPEGGDKAAWIRDGFPAVRAAFPEIRGVIWFDVLVTEPIAHPDWRLATPPAARDAYVEVLGLPGFGARLIP